MIGLVKHEGRWENNTQALVYIITVLAFIYGYTNVVVHLVESGERGRQTRFRNITKGLVSSNMRGVGKIIHRLLFLCSII
jgi:hypothetical protein